MSELIALESVVLVTAVMFAVLRIAGDVRKIRLHLIPPPVKPAKTPKAAKVQGFVPPPIRTPNPAR